MKAAIDQPLVVIANKCENNCILQETTKSASIFGFTKRSNTFIGITTKLINKSVSKIEIKN